MIVKEHLIKKQLEAQRYKLTKKLSNINDLKKHYKLWIESTGILQNIINSETVYSTVRNYYT